jgi:FADH2-dependent halogenase
MSESAWDAIIIGGGPGGSAAATFLAKAGRRVLLLEKEVFPRFHIGESLLPYNQSLFAEMGVQAELQAHGFVRKFGAQFHLGNGSKSTAFVFSQGAFTRQTEAIQVERATFDHILLKHARSEGAEVREGWSVDRFSNLPEGVGVQATAPDGTKHSFTAAFLLDASGRGNLTGNQEGLREVHPRLKKVAIFGHFHGVRRDACSKGGDTVIVRLENKWFWLIPISAEKTSIGCVMDREEFIAMKRSPAEVFHHWVRSSQPMRERMENARLLGSIQSTGDFSYRNRRLVGPRLMRIGDAAGFMDPIFSAGVYLAMFSGKLAAEAVDSALRSGTDGAPLLARYEQRIRGAMATYWEMVENFYTTPFMEVFLEPRNKWNLPAAVNAVLAGELEGGWRMKWRLRLFFWVVKMQARWPLVPRVSFAPLPDETPADPVMR